MQIHAFGFSYTNDRQPDRDTHITTNRPWGNLEAPKPGLKYQPPSPPLGSFYPGSVSDNGWYAPQPPASGHATGGVPSVEVEVGSSDVYQQQNLVYTVHVVSNNNIKTLDPELPRIENATLELLDGPVVSTRVNDRTGKREILNSYHFKLMPLRSGEISIPPIRFSGTHADQHQPYRNPGIPVASPGSFEIAADKPLDLDVLPPNPSVRPWLPLHDLKVDAHLLQAGPATAGVPVTLELELKAIGAMGSQLPSLWQRLESPRYRIYRDETVLKNGITGNGRYLTGSRKETYTIIPLEDGLIRMPEVSVAWWSVDRHAARQAVLPFTHVANDGRVGEEAFPGGGNARFPAYFWAPMVIALSLVAGFWLGAWRRTRPLVDFAGTWLSAAGRGALRGARHIGGKIAPVRLLARMRMGLAVLMPRSVKIWMCTRCLRDEDNPEAWCAQFRSRVCGHLDINPHAPLVNVVEKLIAASPQAEPGRVRALARSIDNAIYGDRTLDFRTWKHDLLQELRPRLLFRRLGRNRPARDILPALNPHTASRA